MNRKAISQTEKNNQAVDAAGDAQGIFDERFSLFTDTFGSICEKENVKSAIAIIMDPKLPKKPIVFLRGNEYDAAQLLAALLRQLQQQILSNITP